MEETNQELGGAQDDAVSTLQPQVNFMQQFHLRASVWALCKVRDPGLNLEDFNKLNLPSSIALFLFLFFCISS